MVFILLVTNQITAKIHAQIDSKSKLFSNASTNFESTVNENVSLFDAAIPGTLPVLNERCVEAGVLTALALSCQINPISYFDRKHYFYADLPAGFQITQQRCPLAKDGEVQFPVFHQNRTCYLVKSKLKQLQLEQDSAKSLHTSTKSLVDLNRAGIPLMELVFEPDLKDGEEAAALVKELVAILTKIGTCSCRMQEGALRVDANVSIKTKNSKSLGVRTEIKNIGSIRGVANAINYEIRRQIDMIQNNIRIINETRHWDAQNKCTVGMRDKEVKQDYRFMPEPNLPPIHLKLFNDDEDIFTANKFESNSQIKIINVAKISEQLGELPETTRQKLSEKYNLSYSVATLIVSEKTLLNYFETIMNETNEIKRDSKLVANVLLNELLEVVNKYKLDIEQIPVDYLSELIDLLQQKHINLLAAQKTLDIIATKIVTNTEDLNESMSPKSLVIANNWFQISSENEILKICEDILRNNEKLVIDYRNGKKKVFKAILGQVAKRNNVNMQMASTILKKLLEQK